MRHVIRLLLVLAIASASSAGAQKTVKEPGRPKLGADADTNDAGAYYRFGVSQIDGSPQDAADAFYWAIRLDPTVAEGYYARWAALHLSDKYRLVAYYQRDKKTMRSVEVRQLDSLRLRAMSMNPYLYRKFEKIMFQHYLESYIQQQYPGVDQAELSFELRKMLGQGGPETKAINAYTSGNFPYALEEYAAAMNGYRDQSYLHAERGRIFYMLGAYDSAATELTLAVKQMRAYDKDEVVFIYESKALYEESLGMIAEKQGRPDSAREAYGRALLEDLSFAPAHLKLGAIDLAKGDTAAAINEFDVAAQVQPNDGVIAYLYGRTLLLSARDALALEQLKRAATLEPYYAEPRFLLALIYDNSDYKEDAIANYTEFVRMTRKSDARIAKAKERMAALGATAATPPAKP
jgi:Tfp pilus assembly protein PilF